MKKIFLQQIIFNRAIVTSRGLMF